MVNLNQIVDWHKYFKYDTQSPSLIVWNMPIHSGNGKVQVHAGELAGYMSVQGYWTVKVNRKAYKVHRILWEMFNGEIPPKMQIDHIDGNRSNNSLMNLRLVTHRVNGRNQKRRTTNTSGVTGVNIKHLEDGETQYIARWKDCMGKEKSKTFNTSRFGADAFRLACEYRKEMLDKLNLEGAGYSPTHGK